MFTYISGDIMSRSFEWSGVQTHDALLYGGGLALLFQLYVEVEDGFHPDLGFSIQDGIADVAGAAFPLLQHKSKVFRLLTPKWSAHASPSYQQGKFRTIIDDYESQYYWMSVNLENLLGKESPSWLPGFLNVAVGYSVKNLDYSGNGEKELYLALDCDFEKLPGEGSFLKALKHLANYFHCPAPTLRLVPAMTAFGIRF